MVVELKYEESVYEDSEDSWFIQDFVKNYVSGKKPKTVLDMGTGTGILAIQAKISGAENVFAVDINEKAIDLAKKNAKLNDVEISVFKSNLFSDVSGKFELIVFNPPYLPGKEHLDLEGGVDGIEVTLKFLAQAKEHLEDSGKIILVASSLADLRKLEIRINELGFSIDEKQEKKIAFEQLFILLLSLQ